jgi:integrase
MALTQIQIISAKPREKLYRIADSTGLCLEIPPRGNKRWRFRYSHGGKAKMISIGTFPEISLKDARLKRDAMRQQVANGIDPSKVRQERRAVANGKYSFETIAREWYGKMATVRTAGHAKTVIDRLESNVFPYIGAVQIHEITPQDILSIVQNIEKRRAYEVARRVRGICSQVFRYAIILGYINYDPADAIRGALAPAPRKSHHACIVDEKGIGELLRAIDEYSGAFTVSCALRLAPYVFVRPNELRFAEWKDFNLDVAEWRIPFAKMKEKKPHIVPLSRQSIDILYEVRELTGDGRYVFTSPSGRTRPLSENTFNVALRRLGFTKEQMTCHGFRGTASTRLNELGWKADLIEKQLAHNSKDKVRAAYNHADYLPERKVMMQWWADYLDSLRARGRGIPLPKVMSG